MPNRILKDSICTSDNIDQLSTAAEVFFYRLLVQCDDYGRMDARPSVLRSKCFPLKLGRVGEAKVSAWLSELSGADLVWVYVHEGRPYLQITKWSSHQQVRATKSKYPEPITTEINGNQLQSIVPEYESEIETDIRETNTNTDMGAGAPQPRQPENPEGKPQEEKSPEPLSVGQRNFLKAFGAKRFKNDVQKFAVLDLEKKFGTTLLDECVNWAAKKGFSLSDAVVNIEKAIPNWGKPKPERKDKSNGTHNSRTASQPTGELSKAQLIARQLSGKG